MSSEKKISLHYKRIVFNRANGHCEYCMSPASHAPDPFSVEHIFPKSLGGKSTSNNLGLSCQGCSGHKYVKTKAIDPMTGTEQTLFNPRTQQWTDHFS